MGPLQQFSESLWIAEGPTVRTFGFPFPTRMVVVKLADGTVWINSPVLASRKEMESLAGVGPVKHLVAPTPLHEWRLTEWTHVFPNALVWVAPLVRNGRSARRNILTDQPPAAWADDLDQNVFRGSAMLNEVHFLHRKSKTLIFCDLIQNYAPQRGRWLRNGVMRWAGVLGGGVPIDARLSFAYNKAQARTSLHRLLSWDFDGIILAHGDGIDHDAKAFVRTAFHWLAP